MRTTVVLSGRGRLALAERVELVRRAVGVDDVVVATRPGEAWRALPRRCLPYLLDVNRVTAGVAAALAATGRPYVVDTGDDPSALARATRGRAAAVGFGAIEGRMVRRARAVVCRGSFHQPVLRGRTGAPLWWAPDTVPDEILDAPCDPDPDPSLVATFGSAAVPLRGDRAYGWEVVDLVATERGLRGLLVVSGPGIGALRARAIRLGVADRVAIEGPRPLGDLAARLGPAGFVTSVQSDDLAGWVRTTGKLPIALGLGKPLVATRVGEATRVLPAGLLVAPGGDASVVRGMADVVRRGPPPGWPAAGRELAQQFRRSTVAADLGEFLRSL